MSKISHLLKKRERDLNRELTQWEIRSQRREETEIGSLSRHMLTIAHYYNTLLEFNVGIRSILDKTVVYIGIKTLWPRCEIYSAILMIARSLVRLIVWDVICCMSKYLFFIRARIATASMDRKINSYTETSKEMG